MSGFIKCPVCGEYICIDDVDLVEVEAEALDHLEKHLKRLKNPEKIRKVKELMKWIENPIA